MKKILLQTLAGLSLAVSSWAVSAADRTTLDNFFTQVNTMQAQFTQEVYDDGGKLRQKSQGNVFLSRPGKFSWEYRAPEAHRIVADGKNVWVHDVELDQVTVKPMSQALSAAPVGLLLNKQPVEKQFRVTELEPSGGMAWFNLIPHRRDSDFTAMDLGVSDRGIQEMVLRDKFGQETKIRFNGMSLNPAIPANRFQFTPPAGVDVIGKPS
ncbi:MAG: outer membrane lipoprotein chaperone LolA [Thiofilum sp.]|uniref:outer membrane lipoprotein chaperone LolA n=1 Tax=Thiofilum sp. TaxID=2212733 RepID=UPI0025F3922A|nr:outer membrane lipoprotein chaperone LolA [Thiofilum sp.]MBK8454204.1 outer membrane lipoprotein chaperone LolA [Thiofilum sp.]